jgi:hypothetical protein
MEVDGIPAIKLIAKSRQQEPRMMTYLGALTFPRRDFSYVLKIQCSEYGITGIREAVVGNRCSRDGRVIIDKDQIRGWAADPYDSSIQDDVLNTLADAEEYDAEFPDHPISRLRRYLRTIQESVVISVALRSAHPFQGID